jgi:hypothetical protein
METVWRPYEDRSRAGGYGGPVSSATAGGGVDLSLDGNYSCQTHHLVVRAESVGSRRRRARESSCKPVPGRSIEVIHAGQAAKNPIAMRGVHNLPASLLRIQTTTRTITTGIISHKNTKGLVLWGGSYPAATHSRGGETPTLNLTSKWAPPAVRIT